VENKKNDFYKVINRKTGKITYLPKYIIVPSWYYEDVHTSDERLALLYYQANNILDKKLTEDEKIFVSTTLLNTGFADGIAHQKAEKSIVKEIEIEKKVKKNILDKLKHYLK